MPTWVKFAGLWSLAAVAALALSWVAVSQVRDRVIQPVTVIPTTIAALEESIPDPAVIAVDPESNEQAESTPTTAPTVESTTNTTRTSSSGSASPPTTAPPRTTTTTAAPTTSAPPQTTTSAPPSNLETSSYSVPGGSVTIRSAPGEVSFVSAVPQAGFTTELRDKGPERVRVRFVSATLISEFEAEWDDGQLDIETSEHTP